LMVFLDVEAGPSVATILTFLWRLISALSGWGAVLIAGLIAHDCDRRLTKPRRFFPHAGAASARGVREPIVPPGS
jgi:hypothetical protein